MGLEGNMRRLVVLLVVLVAVAGAAVGALISRETVSQAPVRWEYKAQVMFDRNARDIFRGEDTLLEDGETYARDTTGSGMESWMNLMGGEGWEAVGFIHEPQGNSVYILFKRPVQ